MLDHAEFASSARIASVSITDTLSHADLLGPWFSGQSWATWRAILRAAFGLSLDDAERALFHAVAERDPPIYTLPRVLGVGRTPRRQGQRCKRDRDAFRSVRQLRALPSPRRARLEYVSLRGVSASDMAAWLQAALGTKVRISTTPQGNAVLILGLPEDIQAANEVIGTLDQPRLAGDRSLRIEPVFWSAAQLSEKLIDILRAEGYFVGPNLQNPGAVVVLPLRPSNTLVVFASDQKTLTHVEAWVRDLDHASQIDPQRSLFFYRVRNTTAESLAAVLNSVLQGRYAARDAATPSEAAGPPSGQPPFPPGCTSRRPSGDCRWTSPGNPAVWANRDRPGA